MSFEAGNLFSCTNLVVVITGGGSGLGSYAAKALDVNGAKAVYIIGRRKASLDKVAASCPNGSVRAIVGDVTDHTSLSAAAAQIEREVGYINVLFANAGVPGQVVAPKLQGEWSIKDYQDVMSSTSPDIFTNAFHVNVTGVHLTVNAFLGLLEKGNQSRNVEQKSQIITTGSGAGYSRVMAVGLDYSGSKAATMHLTKMMSTMFARFKIRANSISPGFFPSEMTKDMPPFKDGKDATKEGGLPASSCPLERAGSPQDFAGAVLFLCSPAGAYINGNVIVTDGGRISISPSTY